MHGKGRLDFGVFGVARMDFVEGAKAFNGRPEELRGHQFKLKNM